MIQIEIENGTVFRRRIFLHATQMPLNEPIPLALTAWKVFDLGPGVSIGTVDGDFQIGVRVSRIVHGVDHRTVMAEASYGDAFRVDLTNGIPVLTRTATGHDSLEVVNGLSGPQSYPVDVALYRDYAPLLNREVPAGSGVAFPHPAEFYCYASMPFERDDEALALEPIGGKVDLGIPGNIKLQIVPAGSMVHWKVNGKPADIG